MERFRVSVSVANSNGTEKIIEESHEGSLKTLIIALKNLKGKTNDYLTELVAEEKRNQSQEVDKNENAEDSDVELVDDYIDSEIKKGLLTEQSSSHSINKSDKRTKSCKKNMKKAKH